MATTTTTSTNTGGIVNSLNTSARADEDDVSVDCGTIGSSNDEENIQVYRERILVGGSYFPPDNSEPGSDISEWNGMLHDISSLFPATKSETDSSSLFSRPNSNSIKAIFSPHRSIDDNGMQHDISSLFPATKSETDASSLFSCPSSNSNSIMAIFPPRRSIDDFENDEIIIAQNPSISSYFPAYFSDTTSSVSNETRGKEDGKKMEKKPEEKKMEEKKPEEKKMEEKKPEEEKKEEKKAEEEKEEAAKDGKESKEAKEEAPPPPPPPQEIVLKVYMHCEGCARKVRRCLKGFEGVEDVITDCKISKVVVKGEKADPLKVLERVQRKSHRQVELISPIPKPKAEEEKKPEEAEKPKPEEKKEEPQIITVVLKVHMHCEACAQGIKKRILKMKGVESAEPDLKSSEVTVKGVFDPPKLVEYVYKRTGKHAVIVKQEPEKKDKEESKDGKEEKKAEEGGGGGDKETKAKEEKKEGKGEEAKPEAKEAAAATTEETNKMIELQANASQHYPQRYFMEMYPQRYATEMYPQRYANEMYPQRYANEMYPYPPQIFSDENPNACSVM